MSDYRLDYITPDQLDASQQAIYDAITGGRRAQAGAGRGSGLTNDEGGLVGPFNALLYAPDVGDKVQAVGEAVRFETEIENRLLEIGIITVGREWTAEFEWYAHARFAKNEGVSDDVIEAIRTGAEPPFTKDDERIVYTFADQLVRLHHVDDDAYAAAQKLLGDKQLVELTYAVGYYCLVSSVLNTFRSPLPDGVDKAFS